MRGSGFRYGMFAVVAALTLGGVAHAQDKSQDKAQDKLGGDKAKDEAVAPGRWDGARKSVLEIGSQPGRDVGIPRIDELDRPVGAAGFVKELHRRVHGHDASRSADFTYLEAITAVHGALTFASERLRATAGLRYETVAVEADIFRRLVATTPDTFIPDSIESDYDALLPSVNVTYSLRDALRLRRSKPSAALPLNAEGGDK